MLHWVVEQLKILLFNKKKSSYEDTKKILEVVKNRGRRLIQGDRQGAKI